MITSTQAHLSEAQLNDLADGLLRGEERLAALRHLDACARCRAGLDELQALLTLSRETRVPVETPPELWPLVAATTIHETHLRRWALRRMRAPLLAGAILLVLATALVTTLVFARLRPLRPDHPVVVPPAPHPPRAPAP